MRDNLHVSSLAACSSKYLSHTRDPRMSACPTSTLCASRSQCHSTLCLVLVFLEPFVKEQCLCIAEDSGAAAKRICRVQGVAVCWNPEAVYYIPLNPAAPGVHKLVGSMLGSSRAKKVTYDLKAQMLALLTGEHIPSNCASWTGMLKCEC